LAKQALVELYEHHSPRLYRYAYRLLGNADLAEECVAETFSRFLKVLYRTGTQPENVQAYLFRSAHNWIMDQYRVSEPEELDPEKHVDTLANPAMVVTKELDSERVRRALLQLTDEQRQVITLRFLEDWPHDQVAATIGKSIEATRTIQHRAINALRRLLIEKEE
jgi:RNA polymerase sigma-70 factor (ECF subfamily)